MIDGQWPYQLFPESMYMTLDSMTRTVRNPHENAARVQGARATCPFLVVNGYSPPANDAQPKRTIDCQFLSLKLYKMTSSYLLTNI